MISESTVWVRAMNLGCGSLYCARQSEQMPISFSSTQSRTVNPEMCCNPERIAAKLSCETTPPEQEFLSITDLTQTMWKLSQRVNISIRIWCLFKLCWFHQWIHVSRKYVCICAGYNIWDTDWWTCRWSSLESLIMIALYIYL